MTRRRSAREWLVGDPAEHRRRYLLAAAVAALVVFGMPDGMVSDGAWVFGGIAVLVAAVAGAARYGLLTAFVATAAYVAAVGQAAYLASTGVEYPILVRFTRLSLVLVTVTVVLAVPSYLLGVGARVAARRATG